MKVERRTYWYLWSCDRTGCDSKATTHPGSKDHDPVEDSDIPDGWTVVEPPRFWKGPALAFCSIAHRNEWAQDTVGPLLLGSGG